MEIIFKLCEGKHRKSYVTTKFIQSKLVRSVRLLVEEDPDDETGNEVNWKIIEGQSFNVANHLQRVCLY